MTHVRARIEKIITTTPAGRVAYRHSAAAYAKALKQWEKAERDGGMFEVYQGDRIWVLFHDIPVPALGASTTWEAYSDRLGDIAEVLVRETRRRFPGVMPADDWDANTDTALALDRLVRGASVYADVDPTIDYYLWEE